MVDNIEQRIYDFVLNHAGRYIFKKPAISPETDLDTDLNFDDDEAEELMDAFFTEFEVEKGGFSIKTYYPDIPVSLNPFKRKEPVPVPDFTLGMLINSAKAGRWLYD
ncbi:DUF1493 family protein [Salmonella enterica]